MTSISPARSQDYYSPEQGQRDYSNIRGVANNPNVTPAFLREVEAIAQRIGTQPEYLLAVMSFETGGTFSPGVRNAAGSGATGLIQFMPGTARGLGTSTEALARMSAEEQLQYVERYFAGSNPGDLATLEGLYTKVLYGSPVSDPNATLFSGTGATYTQNAGLDINRDGRITAGEATAKVRETISGEVPGPATSPGPGAQPASVSTPGGTPGGGSTPAGSGSHDIVWGDTLSALAMTFKTSVDALVAANRDTISDPDLIYAGNSLRLPGEAGGQAPASQPGTGAQPASAGGSGAAAPAGGGAPQVVSGDPYEYHPFNVYSTGERQAVLLSEASQQQPHHDYQTTTVNGQQLEVRDIVLDGRNGGGQQQQPIPAPIDGEVIFAGPNGNAGNMVTIRGSDGQLVRLFHMSSIDVQVGQQVRYGQDLGNQGTTGNSTGPHVHVEASSAVIDRWVNDLIDGKFDGHNA